MAARAASKKDSLPEWDLSDLYRGIQDPAISKDLKAAERASKDFQSAYEGKVEGLAAENLAEAIKEFEELQDLLGRLSSYAQLVYAGNMSDTAISQFHQNIQEKINELSTITLFFTLAINKIPDEDLQTKLKNKKLQHYQPWLRDVRVYRKYQLSDEMEKLLHEKYVAGKAAWMRLFDETLAELRFPIDGKKMTSAEALHVLSSKNPAMREKAAKSLGKVLGENVKTFALITNTLAKDKEIEDRWRGFERPISSRNLSNYVEDKVVDALIYAVKSSYPRLSHRYYRLKAQWMGGKTMPYWDRNAPLPQDNDRLYKWQEARELVLSSYMAFSPTLAKLGKDFFDKNWIDVPTRPGKAPGAFAHPTVPSAHPYLLLNFQGKAQDVMTLAHELGHGVHQCLSASKGTLMSDTPLTLAETASVFGEQLTFREMLRREKDAKKRNMLIASKVEDMLNTVIRQIAFCEFERQVHDERRDGELAPERIGEIWMSIQKESLGPAIKFYPEYAAYWTYIPHFIHSPFYVYAYAFGDCLVNALYAVYQEDSKKGKAKEFEKKYLEMLSAGGTMWHKELLAPFGLDASKASFWQKGLSVIEEFIDMLEQ